MSRIHRRFLALLGLLLFALPLPARAQSSGYTPASVAEIDVLPGWRATDGTQMAAIRIRLADGWKTYWRAPGEAGIPPSFDWTGSVNLGAVAFHWPVPEVFDQNGMRTIGYKHELVLPVTLTPKRADRAITLKGQISLGVCRDVCMPMQADLFANMPATAQAADGRIQRALDQRPDTAGEAGVGTVACDIDPIKDGLRVTARLSMPRLGPGEVAVIETADQAVWVSEAMTRRQGHVLTAVSDMVPPDGAPFLLNRSDVRITVLAAGRAVDISGCLAGS